jgi:hypothetical protein
MNRRQRRRLQAHDASAKRIRELQHRVEQTGQPGVIHGLTDACRDCRASGDLVLPPGRRTVGHIWHDEAALLLPVSPTGNSPHVKGENMTDSNAPATNERNTHERR